MQTVNTFKTRISWVKTSVGYRSLGLDLSDLMLWGFIIKTRRLLV